MGDMSIFFRLVFVLLLLATCLSGLILNITSQNRQTTCSKGLRLNRDRLVFEGQLNATGINMSAASNIVSFQTDGNSQCGIAVKTGSCGFSTEDGYCSKRTEDLYELVCNITAREIHNNTRIFMRWTIEERTKSIKSNEIDVFPIYDENAAILVLKVDNQVVLKVDNPVVSFGASDICPFNLTAGKNSTLELCCYNSASPCNPKISLAECFVVKETGDCTSCNIFAANDSFTANLDLSYSMCTGSKDIRSHSCKAIAVNETVPNDSGGLGGLEDWETGLIAGGCIVAAIAIIGGIILLYKKKCEKKCQIRHSKTGTESGNFNKDKESSTLNCETKRYEKNYENVNPSQDKANGQDKTGGNPSQDETDGMPTQAEKKANKDKKYKDEDNNNKEYHKEKNNMEIQPINNGLGPNQVNPRRVLPPIQNTGASVNTSSTSGLPLRSNFPTSLGVTTDPHPTRPASVEVTALPKRPLPALQT